MSRREAKLSGESASGVFTIREVLFVRLVIESAKYIEVRDVDQSKADIARGIMRGMAMAITKAYGNGYEPYWATETRYCEQTAHQLARRWIRDGKPEGDDWWVKHQRRFWRSTSDASSADQRELRRSQYRA